MFKVVSQKVDAIKGIVERVAKNTNQKIEDTERLMFGKIEDFKN